MSHEEHTKDRNLKFRISNLENELRKALQENALLQEKVAKLEQDLQREGKQREALEKQLISSKRENQSLLLLMEKVTHSPRKSLPPDITPAVAQRIDKKVEKKRVLKGKLFSQSPTLNHGGATHDDLELPNNLRHTIAPLTLKLPDKYQLGMGKGSSASLVPSGLSGGAAGMASNGPAGLITLNKDSTVKRLNEFVKSRPTILTMVAELGSSIDHRKLEVYAPRSNVAVVTLQGPKYTIQEKPEVYQERASGWSISTYPIKEVGADGTIKREGDPICDSYILTSYHDRTIFALSDGCNWGNKAREAAQKSTSAFMLYLTTHQPELRTVTDLKKIILFAVTKAHDSIIAGKKDIFDAGTTTIIGGIVIPFADESNPSLSSSPSSSSSSFSSLPSLSNKKHLLMCVSIGDCKAYHLSYTTRRVTDVTTGNRGNLSNPNDPGGRIGPVLEEGSADLRNLRFFSQICEENDLILIVSDGVHDNLDPEKLGLPPSDGESWATIDPQLGAQLKTDFACNQIEKILGIAQYTDDMVERDTDFSTYSSPGRKAKSSSDFDADDKDLIFDNEKDSAGIVEPEKDEITVEPFGFHHRNTSPSPLSPRILTSGRDSVSPTASALISPRALSHSTGYEQSLNQSKGEIGNSFGQFSGSTGSAYFPTAEEVTKKLVEYCSELTESSRTFMETNKKQKLPNDFQRFPGKMDHTTCLTFQVKNFKSVT